MRLSTLTTLAFVTLIALGSPAEAKKHKPKSLATPQAEVLSPEEGMELLYQLATAAAEQKIQQAIEATPPRFSDAEVIIAKLSPERKAKWMAIVAVLHDKDDVTYASELFTMACQHASCQKARATLNEAREYLGAKHHIMVPACAVSPSTDKAPTGI